MREGGSVGMWGEKGEYGYEGRGVWVCEGREGSVGV